MSYASEWRGLAYWICTFSNNQWNVGDELGNGDWQDFGAPNLKLRCPEWLLIAARSASEGRYLDLHSLQSAFNFNFSVSRSPPSIRP